MPSSSSSEASDEAEDEPHACLSALSVDTDVGERPALLTTLPIDTLLLIAHFLQDALSPCHLSSLSRSCTTLTDALADAIVALRRDHRQAERLCLRCGITVSGLVASRELKWYEKELGSADAPVLGLVLKSDVLIKLEVLWLNYNHLGDDGAIELALAVGSGSMPRLRKLELRHGEIGDAGLRALSHATCTGSGALKKLETLDLSENCIGDGGVCAFASALTTGALPRLSLLDLDDNEIGAAGVYALMAAAAHKKLSRLEWLNLRRNDFGREGAIVLARHCRRLLPSLRELWDVP